ncbi:cation:proton antiporter [bacterium]|nr:cation:proton antiporter [bacterium]
MPTIVFTDIFGEIAVLLLVATIAGVIAARLRQPLIIGFIAIGMLVGRSGLNLIRSTDQIHAMAEMGLALLLFVVGLKLDIRLIRSMGRIALVAGVGQVVFTTIGGFLIAYALGMNIITSFYVAVALTFSSTIIIVKLLSDKREADSLHGRLALGILIIQDVVVVLAMIALSAFSKGQAQHPVYLALLIAAKGVGLIAGVWLISTLILPRLLPFIAKTTELLILFGIMWALGLANVGEALGFSKEIGAFLAGVSLASTPFRETIGVRLISLRDFLLVFFFVELGARLDLGLLGTQVWSAIPLSLFVLIGDPIIVMMIMAGLGYRKRTNLLTGITLGQVSEFSLILIAMGAKLGHIGDGAVGVVTLVALVTISLSTYMISYSQPIYNRLVPYLGLFERRVTYREDSQTGEGRIMDSDDVMLFGLGSYGTGIAEQLEARGRRVIGVDFDPQAVSRWRERGWDAIFGDANDTEIASALHLEHIKWIVSSIRDEKINASLMRSLQSVGYTGYTAVSAYDRPGEETITNLGVDVVLSPFADAAVEAADLIFITEEQVARKAMDRLIDSMSGHYIICGYGRMGQQIVKDLKREGVPCVVVEYNVEQLPKLKEQNIPYIEGKATEDAVLEKAGINRAKGLIAVAASDEENVFIVLTAKVLNPDLFIVARSIQKENEDKLRHAGANMVMSPYVLGGRRMAAAVIRPDVMDFLDLVLHTDGIETDIASVTVPPESKCTGKTLHDINLLETVHVTVLAVRRHGEDMHANPDTGFTIAEGDELIVMGTPAQIAAAGEMLSAKE